MHCGPGKNLEYWKWFRNCISKVSHEHTAVGLRGELVAAFTYIVNRFAVHGLHEFLHRVAIKSQTQPGVQQKGTVCDAHGPVLAIYIPRPSILFLFYPVFCGCTCLTYNNHDQV